MDGFEYLGVVRIYGPTLQRLEQRRGPKVPKVGLYGLLYWLCVFVVLGRLVSLPRILLLLAWSEVVGYALPRLHDASCRTPPSATSHTHV